MAKDKRVVTKNIPVEETNRLVDDGDEKVRDGWSSGEDEDDTDEDEGARDSAHLAVVQGEADRDVALHGHAGQDERGGTGGEDCCHNLKATQGQGW